MIITKLKKFLDKLIEATANGHIGWETISADAGVTYKCEFDHDVIVESSSNFNGVSHVVSLKIIRRQFQVNILLAPQGSEMEKLVSGLFEIIYSKELGKGLSLLESNGEDDNGEENDRLNIMDIFPEEKSE